MAPLLQLPGGAELLVIALILTIFLLLPIGAVLVVVLLLNRRQPESDRLDRIESQVSELREELDVVGDELEDADGRSDNVD